MSGSRKFWENPEDAAANKQKGILKIIKLLLKRAIGGNLGSFCKCPIFSPAADARRGSQTTSALRNLDLLTKA
jgi:hypothetical protein